MKQKEIDYLFEVIRKNIVFEDDIVHHTIRFGSKTDIDSLLKRRKKGYSDIPWKRLCLMLTIEKYHDVYKTLCVDIDNNVIVSTKSTRQLIGDFTDRLGLTYEQFVEKTAKRQYKVPYVFKHFVILPDGGVTKQNVNWLFLNHLTGFEQYHKSDDMIFYFAQKIEVVCNINIEFFNKQLQFIMDTYKSQLQGVSDWQITDYIRHSYIYGKTLETAKKSHHEHDLKIQW